MKQTFTVLVYLKTSKINSKGMAPICIRVTVNGKRSEISIKQFIEPSRWNSNRQRLTGTSYRVKTINKSIELAINRINDIHNDLIQNNKLVTAKAITNKYLGRDQLGKTLLEVFSYHNNRMKSYVGKKYTRSTYVKYNTTFHHLKDFINQEFRTDDVLLLELNHAFIDGFEHFLTINKQIGVNTTNKYLSHLKKIVNLAIQNEWLLRNPFVNFRTKNEDVVIERLTEQEIGVVSNLRLTHPSHQKVRDIFLFCCFTGLSYIDIKNLSKDDISVGIDGNIWIRKRRQKTGGLSRIKLLEIASDIMNKYKSDNQFVFPVSSNQNMNRILKKITSISGLEKPLSMHMARHTFATYAMTKNVSIETISQMLGHKSIKSTQIYAKVVDSKISDEMDMFNQTIPNTIKLSEVV